ncbi:RDD family protein [Actinomadura sp. 9N407]|uniref:RDD family protein n=1 Tax=Actinomadura sp. 9N407 TaxID=3375154 RepID=UPI0037A9474D
MAADQAPGAGPLSDEEPGRPAGAPGLPAEPVMAEPLMAEPAQRLVARIVDTLVVGLPVMLAVRETVPPTDVDIVAPPAVAGFLLLYEWIQLALWGRTLGKRFAGIEVVSQRAAEGVSGGLDVSRPGAGRSLLRTALYALPIGVRPVPVFGLIAGLFWVGNAAMMYEGGRRQALHDRLAGTIVVKRTS